MRKFVGIVVGIVLCLPFFGWATVRIVQDIQFSRVVTGHLKRAADANTIELAEKEMAGVISQLKQRGLTSGYTSVLWTVPSEDVEFWYNNLNASLEELRKVSQGASQLEKSNVLIKLRETLVDHGQSVSVTEPDGISIFPHNVLYFWWGWGSLFLGIVGVVSGFIIGDNPYR